MTNWLREEIKREEMRRKCYCPSDCNCRHQGPPFYRPNYCGCKQHPNPATEGGGMTTALSGETIRRPGTDETRVPINIDSEVRELLRNLLFEPWMRGVGYSEFIARAIQRTREEHEEH